MATAKKDVILFYPEGRRPGNFPHQTGTAYTVSLPLSLLPLAHVLQQRGYNPIIVDARIQDYRKVDLKDALCVGISSMSGVQLLNALDIAQHIRHERGDLPIIWGGIHPTLLPEQTIQHELVDIVVQGEGEVTLVELLSHLEEGAGPEGVAGVVYKEDGKIINNGRRGFMDLNTLGPLPYHLLPMLEYKDDDFTLNTSRGCPHTCAFCYNLAFNKRRWRFQKAELVLEQLEAIFHQFHPQAFIFYEDDFFVSKQRVREVCQGMISRGLTLPWQSTCRVDYASHYEPAFLELMRQSGCRRLTLGGESGSPELLARISKGTSVDQMIETARRCKTVDIVPIFSFMVGFPFETEEDIQQTFNAIDGILGANEQAQINGIFIYTPYPGTPLFHDAVANNLRVPVTLEEWSHFQFANIANLPWIPRERRSLLNTIYRLSRFPFYQQNGLSYPPLLALEGDAPFLDTLPRHAKRLAYRLMQFSARVRWQWKFFAFPWEWNMWTWYAERAHIW